MATPVGAGMGEFIDDTGTIASFRGRSARRRHSPPPPNTSAGYQSCAFSSKSPMPILGEVEPLVVGHKRPQTHFLCRNIDPREVPVEVRRDVRPNALAPSNTVELSHAPCVRGPMIGGLPSRHSPSKNVQVFDGAAFRANNLWHD